MLDRVDQRLFEGQAGAAHLHFFLKMSQPKSLWQEVSSGSSPPCRQHQAAGETSHRPEEADCRDGPDQVMDRGHARHEPPEIDIGLGADRFADLARKLKIEGIALTTDFLVARQDDEAGPDETTVAGDLLVTEEDSGEAIRSAGEWQVNAVLKVETGDHQVSGHWRCW